MERPQPHQIEIAFPTRADDPHVPPSLREVAAFVESELWRKQNRLPKTEVEISTRNNPQLDAQHAALETIYATLSPSEFEEFAQRKQIDMLKLTMESKTREMVLTFRAPSTLITASGYSKPPRYEQTEQTLHIVVPALESSAINTTDTELIQYQVNGEEAENMLAAWLRLDGRMDNITCYFSPLPEALKDAGYLSARRRKR